MNINVVIGSIATLAILGGIFYINRPLNKIEAPVLKTDATPNEATPMPWPPEENSNSSSFPTVITPITKTVTATLKTTKGDIVLTLDGAAAPKTVGNFVQLAQADFYDGTSFHRIIPDFMIQGGDPLSKDQNLRARHGTGGPEYTFEDEFNNRKLVRGSLAMANSGPDTNGSQFFIVTTEATPWLDGKHTNFGEVVEGMDVLDAIAAVETDARDNPIEPVVISDVVIEGI